MKDLKKVLALVLVIASLFGLATMASATTSDDYSDADSISHIEAVDVMSTIGVFDGISGAFSGSSILTREQAAKIITYMILGKEDADALVASVAPYTDVSRDRWSAGSIAYCKNEGILAGVGNGRFEPDGKLTGVAFAKMCLVALGYDPQIEGLTGRDWAVNTSSRAIATAGITSNLSAASLSNEMTREDACQMAFNTIKADLVDYDDRGMNVTVNNGNGNNVTISGTPSKAKPITKETSRVDEKNVIGNIKKGNEAGGDETLQFAERYFPKLVQQDEKNDSFGRPAVVWRYKSDEIGTYVDTDDLIQSWTAKAAKGEMYSAIGGSIADNLTKKDGYTLSVWVDGVEQTGVDKDNYFVKNSTAAAGNAVLKDTNIGKSGNGVLTELYMNDADDVTVVMINTYLVQATADYNTSNQRVNVEAKPIDDLKNVSTSFLPTYISNDDFDVTGVKDGDYLLLTVSFNKGWGEKDNDVESVTPATIQTGTVTEYTEHDDVTVGGTKYEYNRVLGDDEKGEEFAIDSSATLVLDTYGYIVYVDEAVSSSSFVYIDNFGSTTSMTSNPVADAYFTDGTNSEISISKVDDEKGKADIIGYTSKKDGKNMEDIEKHIHTRWYTYTGSNGGQYTLTTPSGKRYDNQHVVLTTATGGEDQKLIKSGSVRFMSEAKSVKEYVVEIDTDAKDGVSYKDVRANDKTIFIVKDEDDNVDAYVGIANVPDVALTKDHKGLAKVSWICKKDSQYASYVFIDASVAGMEVDEVSTTTDYMFVLKPTNNRTHVSGDTYYKYTVAIGGKEEERWVTDKLVGGTADDKGRLFRKVKENSNGWITDGDEVKIDKTNDRYAAEMKIDNANKRDVIKQDGSTLYISALDYHITADSELKKTDIDKSNLIANSKSDINLVIGDKDDDSIDLEDLLYDDGADFETHLGVSASFVGSFLNNYKLEGKVYLVVDDEDNDVIDTLWIYVSNAEEIK